MREGLAVALMLTFGCTGYVGTATGDAATDTSTPVDMAPSAGRVKTGLVGLWTFNDQPGSMFAQDVSGKQPPVPAEVLSGGEVAFAPSFSNGRLVATSLARVYTQESSRLAADCMTGGGATLEVWAVPQTNIEGSSTEAAFVVGLASNVSSRNIAILHAANRWRGLVRTNAALDGAPALDSTTEPSIATLSHVVLVADATQRRLYVDGVVEASSPGGALQAWDSTYPLAMFDEYQHARQWTGSLALVALYDHALTEEEVMRNFMAGSESN